MFHYCKPEIKIFSLFLESEPAAKSSKTGSTVTIPHTPKLNTKLRTRSTHDIPSREQQEEKEIEEAKK